MAADVRFSADAACSVLATEFRADSVTSLRLGVELLLRLVSTLVFDLGGSRGPTRGGAKTVPEGATVIYDSSGIAIMDVSAAKLAYDLLTAD